MNNGNGLDLRTAMLLFAGGFGTYIAFLHPADALFGSTPVQRETVRLKTEGESGFPFGGALHACRDDGPCAP